MKTRALITAAEAFPAFEELALSAREELCLSFRIFDPLTRTRLPELRQDGVENWVMLLERLARRGVALRLLISDFDPLLASDLHRNAWRCASIFADKLGGDVQILCAPHGQEAGGLWRLLAWPKIRAKLKGFAAEPAERLTPVQRRVLQTGQTNLRPATLHQKFMVADGARAIIGGLDVDERRYDDPEHRRRSEATWHDVSMAVDDGHFAQVLHSHFGTCWNNAIDSGAPSLSDRLARFDTALLPQNTRDLALVRTRSQPRKGFAVLGPKPSICEHETVLSAAVARARRRIYIETQFLRHRPLAEALAMRAREVPDLNLICLVPTEPENVLYEGDSGLGARHAQSLQVQAVNLVRTAFRDRLAILSPAQPWRANGDEPGTVEGAAPVYLHSKVSIIDDDFALVGSANLNGRSMLWDTEASVLMRDPDAVGHLWQRLAEKWLGQDVLPDQRDLAATWRACALEDAARAPEDRTGYLLPYPITRNRRFARWRPFVPDAMF